ncbi:hypothetical protein VNO77_23353 [Canavalia gladiata]|uniref:Uncharacterized protein n=1 Tax=Canavalia gladiata TaxID=3824 RepID=A0AAN9L7M6_CANGL
MTTTVVSENDGALRDDDDGALHDDDDDGVLRFTLHAVVRTNAKHIIVLSTPSSETGAKHAVIYTIAVAKLRVLRENARIFEDLA